MSTQSETTATATEVGFSMSVDELLAQLALDNYSMVPCQG